LKFGQASDDYANRNDAHFPQESKIIEIAVVKFCLVVPLSFDSDSIPEVVDFVRWNRQLVSIDSDLNIEPPFRPTASPQETINGYWDGGQVFSSPQNVCLSQTERLETFDDVAKLIWIIEVQDARRVVPFIKPKALA